MFTNVKASAQVREKDDRVRQRKLEGFLKPQEDLPEAARCGGDDMEVHPCSKHWDADCSVPHCSRNTRLCLPDCIHAKAVYSLSFHISTLYEQLDRALSFPEDINI